MSLDQNALLEDPPRHTVGRGYRSHCWSDLYQPLESLTLLTTQIRHNVDPQPLGTHRVATAGMVFCARPSDAETALSD
jgi:hypothetical protein